MKRKSKNQIYSVKSYCHENFTVKDIDTSKRIVTGYFNTYNFLDSDREVIIPGAAKRSIDARGVHSAATAKIKHALNHDLTTLPGKLVTLEEKQTGSLNGIYFESKLADTTLGNDTLKNYLAGIYDNHSIGFKYLQGEIISKNAHGNSKESEKWDRLIESLVNREAVGDIDEIAVIKEIQLYEGSTVAFGANSLTPFLGVKAEGGKPKEQYFIMLCDRLNKLNDTVKNGSQSDEMLKDFEIQIFQLQQMMKELTKKLDVNKIVNKKILKKEEEIVIPPTFEFNITAKDFLQPK